MPLEKSQYFDQEIFDKLQNNIVLSNGNAILLGDFNGRTITLEDFVPKNGNNYINDLSNDSLQPKNDLTLITLQTTTVHNLLLEMHAATLRLYF